MIDWGPQTLKYNKKILRPKNHGLLQKPIVSDDFLKYQIVKSMISFNFLDIKEAFIFRKIKNIDAIKMLQEYGNNCFIFFLGG